eukprot:g3772.t1
MISESGTRRVGRLSLLATAMGCIQLCCFAQIGLRAQQTSLQEKKVSDLKELLRSKGLKVSGRKKELVERLLASAEERGTLFEMLVCVALDDKDETVRLAAADALRCLPEADPDTCDETRQRFPKLVERVRKLYSGYAKGETEEILLNALGITTGEACVICQDPLHLDGGPLELRCGHIFHKKRSVSQASGRDPALPSVDRPRSCSAHRVPTPRGHSLQKTLGTRGVSTDLRQREPHPAEGLTAVLFLDVDGVLHPVQARHPRQQFSTNCLALVAEVVKATGASICLSTAWRLDPSARRFVEEKLREVGLGPPVGRTPNLAQFHRSREILAWVTRFKPSTWVALDDWPLNEAV